MTTTVPRINDTEMTRGTILILAPKQGGESMDQ